MKNFHLFLISLSALALAQTVTAGEAARQQWLLSGTD
jgi:hypothetical protein